MNTKEWALILFTLLTQMSVGAFWVLGIVHFFVDRKEGTQEADDMSDRILVAIIVTLGLGMLVSFFHLGNPLNAPKAFINVGSSWLSREILLGVTFTALGVIFVALQWFKLGSTKIRTGVAVVAALVGVGLVYAQAKVYMLPIQPSWNTPATLITFFTTAMLLGVLAVGAALVANHAYLKRTNPDCEEIHCDLLRSVLRWSAVASVVLVGLEFVVLLVYMGDLAMGSDAAISSLELMVGSYLVAFILRFVFAFLGAAVLAVFIYQNAVNKGEEKTLGYLAYSAFVLVFVAEILGRLMFYGTHFPIGI